MTVHDGTAFSASVDWMAMLLTGSVGSAVAILAIAAVGLAMLQGRLTVRDGMRVAFGCFIVFGASTIAQALTDLASRSDAGSIEVYSAPIPPEIVVPIPPQPDADPYAGASVKM